MGLLRRWLGSSSSAAPSAAPASEVPGPGVGSETLRSRSVLDEFYELQERLERAQRRRDGDVVLALCDSAVGMLPALVDAWRDEELESRRILGETAGLGDDWFRISSIRCVELTCRWAAVRGDRDRLMNLRSTLDERPELASWMDDVDRAVANLDACTTLIAAVAADPGVRQAGLAGRLGFDGRAVATLLSWLDEAGRVVRRKEAGTYALFPAATPLPLAALVERARAHPAASANKPVLARPDPPTRDQVQALSGVRFAAIDFETATSARGSACALGVCVVDDCRPVSTQRFLIRPPDNRYDPFNTMIHGIGPTDTARASELPEVWAQAEAIIGDLPVVAHNAAFDVGVLRDGLLAVNVPWPTLDVYCTLVLGRRAWPGLLSYGLVMLVDFCDLRLDNHHDPVADASACAGLGACDLRDDQYQLALCCDGEPWCARGPARSRTVGLVPS